LADGEPLRTADSVRLFPSAIHPPVRGDCGDHGRTESWTAKVNIRTLFPGRNEVDECAGRAVGFLPIPPANLHAHCLRACGGAVGMEEPVAGNRRT